MKILTKEEEQAHYKSVALPSCEPRDLARESKPLIDISETLEGGLLGGVTGLGLDVAGVYGAGVRYPAFRQLTLPLRAFLYTSSATFGGEQ